MTTTLKALREKRAQIAARLADIDDLRPGVLTARFAKYGVQGFLAQFSFAHQFTQ